MSDPFESEVSIRYSDLDTYGHVNNAVYATIVEEARIDYLEAVLETGTADIAGLEDGTGIVVVNLEFDFERMLGRADSVTVETTVEELGRSSVRLSQTVRDEAGPVASVGSTLVVIDQSTGESKAIPGEWREAIEAFEGR